MLRIIEFALHVDNGRIAGSLTSIFANDRGKFELPSYVALMRKR